MVHLKIGMYMHAATKKQLANIYSISLPQNTKIGKVSISRADLL